MAYPNSMKIKEIQGEGLRQKLLKERQSKIFKSVLFALSWKSTETEACANACEMLKHL